MFMTVYNNESLYIEVYTMFITLYVMFVELYTLIFLYIPAPKDFFSAAPGRLARLKSANLLLPLS